MAGAAPSNPTAPKNVPDDFDLAAYLKWNPEVAASGVTTLEQAHEHYARRGRQTNLLYKEVNVTMRYTACGGCMNQLYSHVAAIVLAQMTHTKRIIWPAMQERASFANRYHTNATRNTQTWSYLDAATLFDVDAIARRVKASLGIEVVKHPAHPPMPDMTRPESAYQTHALDGLPHHDQHIRYTAPIYIGRHEPAKLARSFLDAGRQSYIATGRHPSTLLVDLPCTLFMLDMRGVGLAEDVVKLIVFAPKMQVLADKVIAGIRNETHKPVHNGVHLRMEKDARDWVTIVGGPEAYWAKYKAAMATAGFLRWPHPLYVASGLLKASRSDDWSRQEMQRLSREMLSQKYTTRIVYKERYLSQAELDGISNEQAALVDFLVMLDSAKLVVLGVSTFSFFLSELRMIRRKPPEDTTIVMLSHIGTDEIFFSAGLVATRTREALDAQHRLPDICRRPNGSRCFAPSLDTTKAVRDA